MIPVHERADGVSFALRVHPRAKKNAITGEVGDALKVSLTAPPVDGKANEACIEFFARLLKVPRSSVSIAAGAASRNKIVRVAGVSAEDVQRRLEVLGRNARSPDSARNSLRESRAALEMTGKGPRSHFDLQ